MVNSKPIAMYSGPEHCLQVVQEELSTSFDVVRVEPYEDQFHAQFTKSDVLIDASMKVTINSEQIEKASNLRLIVTATTGATHIDAKALSERGIPLLTLKGETKFLRNITPAAEHTWALLMACARQLPSAISHVETGLWNRTEFPGLMLKDRTIGIIGFGRIGRWVAKYAEAFGMTIQFHDPYTTDAPDYAEETELPKLLQSSDIVTTHMHVTDETRGLLSRELLSEIKHGAILVNTARGELADENAILQLLKSGQIAAVGIDVLQDEPEITKSELWKYSLDHKNVIITPHIGGYCPDAVAKVVRFSCQLVKKELLN